MVKNRNFGRKSKFWSKLRLWLKIEILVENRNFNSKN